MIESIMQYIPSYIISVYILYQKQLLTGLEEWSTRFGGEEEQIIEENGWHGIGWHTQKNLEDWGS
jgi:hypothetical protein